MFEHYSELDTGDIGLVGKEALRLFQGLTLDPPRALTASFIDRLFQEVATHRRGDSIYLDFKVIPKDHGGSMSTALTLLPLARWAGLRGLAAGV